MKRVFSNSQAMHVWAQQSQSDGRGSSVLFDGPDIFSYGRHYLAARFHTAKGKKFVLINSHKHSVTTAKHLSMIGSACRQYPTFSSSDPRDIKLAVKYHDGLAAHTIRQALKASKITNQSSINYWFESIRRGYQTASELRAIVGRKPITPKKSDLDAVEKHLKHRMKRYLELNTPEHRAELEAKREKKVHAAHAEKIADFRSGKLRYLNSGRFDLLRVDGDIVRTSGGAEVPLTDAMKLYLAIKAGHDVKGQAVGHFTVTDCYPLDNDKLFKIGCHSILLSEADLVLGELDVMP